MKTLPLLLLLLAVPAWAQGPNAKVFKATISAVAEYPSATGWAVDGYDCTMTVTVTTDSIDAQAEGADQANGAFDVEWVFDNDLATTQAIHDFARASRRKLNVTQCNGACAGTVTLTCWPY